MIGNRKQRIDLVIMFAAALVVTLTFWPRQAARQTVKCQTGEQGWKTYSVALDDPHLDSLRARLETWQNFQTDPNYVTAKWQKELAEHYQQQNQTREESQQGDAELDSAGPTTVSISDTVVRASYEIPVDPSILDEVESADSINAVPSPSDSDYWKSVALSADKTMQTIRESRSQPPIVFAEITPERVPNVGFHFAFLIGLAAACVYMHWSRLCPAQAGVRFRDQSPGVAVRVGTFLGIIAFAAVNSAMTFL